MATEITIRKLQEASQSIRSYAHQVKDELRWQTNMYLAIADMLDSLLSNRDWTLIDNQKDSVDNDKPKWSNYCEPGGRIHGS